MKKRKLTLFLCALLLSLTGCGLKTHTVESVIPPPDTEAPVYRDEVLLTDMKYGDYALSGVNLPFYHWIETANEYFDVGGVRYLNGVFINPDSDFDPGFVEYDISEVSQTYNTFVCKVGKLDAYSGSGGPVIVSFLIDGKTMPFPVEVRHGMDAVLVNIEIPYGSRTMRIECAAEGKSACCSTLICDGRFTHGYLADSVPWPEKE